MNYNELKKSVNKAWESFIDSLENDGFETEQLVKLMRILDNKDCMNDVFDCVIQVAPLESEE